MILKDIISGLDAKTSGITDIEIEGIAYDSRKVKKGFLFTREKICSLISNNEE